MCNVRNKNLVVAFRMDRYVFVRMALLGQFRQIDMKVHLSSWSSSLVSCWSSWTPAKDKINRLNRLVYY